MSLFKLNLQEHLELMSNLEPLDAVIEKSIRVLVQSLLNGGKVLLCGNGGSAADSQHIAAELTGRFIKERPPLAAIALNTDTSALTCIGNDYSFAEIFSRQVRALGRSGDCLIAISTSGNSVNILKAVADAKALGIYTIGLSGREGGALACEADICVVVPSAVTARIQEAHILIGHTICGGIEQGLGLVESEFSGVSSAK